MYLYKMYYVSLPVTFARCLTKPTEQRRTWQANIFSASQ